MDALTCESADDGGPAHPARAGTTLGAIGTTDAPAEADEPDPVRPLYVPVRLGSAGGHQLRFLRTPLGVRTAVGFTSSERLTAVLGPDQLWIRLAAPVLRALAEPLGVTTLTVDPRFTAPAKAHATEAPASAPGPVQPCARSQLWPSGLPWPAGAVALLCSGVGAVNALLG
jgi:hypothetical protein